MKDRPETLIFAGEIRLNRHIRPVQSIPDEGGEVVGFFTEFKQRNVGRFQSVAGKMHLSCGCLGRYDLGIINNHDHDLIGVG